MSEMIICEFCGTLYDPKDGCCPLCHSQPSNAENYMGDHYDYDERPLEEEYAEKKPIGGKITILLCLIALFVGFTGYILYSFEMLPFLTPASTDFTPDIIPCTQLAVNAAELTMDEVGQSVQLQTVVFPAETTDRVIFSVDNPAVASVTQNGEITAKAAGQATVTILCGSYTAYCKVNCSFGDTAPKPESKPEPEPKPESTTDPLTISETDISFFALSESTLLTLTGGDGSPAQWESSDESIATVDKNGYVVAVGSGNAEISAVVGDETVSCIVRCQF